MRSILLLSVSTLLLAGCKTLDFKPEKTTAVAAVPAAPSLQWVKLAPQNLPATDWVDSFSDPVLSGLIREGLAANPSVKVAEARFDAAIARAGISAADLLPSVSGSVSASRSENLGNKLLDRTGLGYGVNANWEPDLWGRIRDGIESSEIDAAASQADYAGARLAVAGQIAQTWFSLLEARLLTDLSARDVETQERAQRLTTRRFEGGVTGSSDVRLARSSVANAQALQAARRQTQSTLTRNLEVLLRRYPSEALRAANDLPVLPALSGVYSPQDMLRRRPDILAAERRMQSAGLSVDVARKALLPSLSLRGGLNVNGSALNNIFDLDSLVANILGDLTQPIFQGGRIKANIAQQEAILLQQLESYADVTLQAYLEVENALDGEQRLLEREQALRVSLEEAVQAESRLERRYSEGLASILQLLDAQSRRISAESQLIGARKERLANRTRLHVALGGGGETQAALRAIPKG